MLSTSEKKALEIGFPLIFTDKKRIIFEKLDSP